MSKDKIEILTEALNAMREDRDRLKTENGELKSAIAGVYAEILKVTGGKSEQRG